MKTAKSYAKSFNQSIKDQYNQWKDYRNEVSSCIKKHMDHHDEHLLIIGPGNLNDIDLNMLKSSFDHITLLDIDIQAVEQGLLLQNLDKNDFHLIEFDLTSFDELDFFPQLKTLLETSSSIETVESFIKKMVFNMKLIKHSPIKKQFYDTIIILPIYTQLVYHQFLGYTSFIEHHMKPSIDIKKLNEFMLNQMIEIIDHVNQLIKDGLKNTGKVFCFSDILQLDTSSQIYKDLSLSAFDKKHIQAYYDVYINQYGYGLGDYGLYSLSKQLISINLDWIIWPFHTDYHYLVKWVYLTKE